MSRSMARFSLIALVAFATVAEVTAALAQGNVANVGGTWSGEVTQQGRASGYSVILVLNGANGTTSYPDQSCTGALKRVGVSANYAFYSEVITRGRYDPASGQGCLDGTVTLRLVSGALYFSWFGADEDGAYSALGTLARVGAPTAPAADGAPPQPAAAAASTAGRLSPQELSATFGDGAPFIATDTNGRQSIVLLATDGSALSKGQPNSEGTRGTWRISKDGYCSKWGTGAEHCYTVRKTANGYDVIDSNNKVAAHWRK